ncbi:Hypothetical predicted protein, partial [Paramuricea clavata]
MGYNDSDLLFWKKIQNKVLFGCNLLRMTAGWGILHHIAGEHKWVDSECDHGPLVDTEVGKMYLNKNCKACDAVRKVVLDERYDALAAIDHNAHVFRKAAITASGKPKHNKVYSKRSNWRIEVVKEPKTYDFWPTIACRIVRRELMMRKVYFEKLKSLKSTRRILPNQLHSNPYPRQVILLTVIVK